MEPTIIGIKQLHKQLSKIAEATQRGKSFVVIKHAKPIFRIEPFSNPKINYTLSDLADIQFSDPKDDKNLSKHIDHFVYGV